MKTTIGIIASLGAVLVACQHDQPPPAEPSATTTTTTTATYQPQPQPQLQQPYAQAESSALSEDRAYGSASTMTNPAPIEPIDPSLEPAQPSTPNAKAEANERKTPGAMDQGNTKSEVKISATIRKQLLASKTLSFGAKNVKIITNGTKVTLKGTVKSDGEKNEIEGVAKNADGVTDVDDQIVVKQ
jgi:osmotically-inducible protein OsmY